MKDNVEIPEGWYHLKGLNDLQTRIGGWRERKEFVTDGTLTNTLEKLGHIFCEVAEAWEELRKPGKTVHSNSFHEELADIIIRILDLSEALGIDMETVLNDKMMKNEGRKPKHGKNF